MKTLFLAPIVSFLGLLIGLWIASMTKDEIRAGRNIFEFLRRIVLSIIIIISFAIAIFNFNTLTIILSIIMALLISMKLKNSRLSYLFLGLISVSILFGTKFMLLAMSTLIFIYGLLYGALLKGNKQELILSNMLMYFLPFLVLLLPLSFGDIMTISSIALIFELRKI